MPRTRHIPWLIIVLGLGFLALSAWSIHLAARGASAVTDADYYRHGLRYNQTLLEQKAAISLGWRATPSLQGRLVAIELRDHEQRPVAGARGSLTLLGRHTPEGRDLGLQESPEGVYRVELPGDIHGEQAAQITFLRDGARLTQRILLSIKPPDAR